ncbi:hypothetical protein [Gorillibacterium massiliense]|uniref:hypothetical protein n=1 Tax=Gorillibacterium massiliense TaxID=1280390 RepID=UPI0012DF9B6D|nr:hypothetical protein [Gorillibacterium massiliense]
MKTRVSWCFAVLALVLLVLLPWQTATAAVLWDTGNLAKVYDPAGSRYAYAPAVIREGNTEHMWTCHNEEDGVIKDSIYYTRIENGVVAESHPVLQAGATGTWDSFHVCDPTVIAGKFLFQGTEYNYALFYLGNDLNMSAHNQIGVAFATELSGEWVKYPDPIVAYPNDGYWGVGQPSATSVDGQGRLLLFFTKGDAAATGGYRIDMNLRDMSDPVIGDAVPLTTNGLTDANGQPDWLNNFDITYDPSRDRFIAIRELHPYPSTQPNYISESLQIVSIDGGSVWGGGGTWKVEGVLGSPQTGFPRNHNGGLLRTVNGMLPDPTAVEAYFTDSDAAPNLSGRAEYTYDIWRIKGTLNDADIVTEKKLEHFKSSHFAVSSMTLNATSNQIGIQGMLDLKKIKPWLNETVWIGYRVYDAKGNLTDAGTAYRDAADASGAFRISFPKPKGLAHDEGRLEVYLLNAKGKPIDSAASKVTFSF